MSPSSDRQAPSQAHHRGERKQSGRLVLNDEPFRIGAGTRGVIDDVRVYTRALTLEEIKALAR